MTITVPQNVNTAWCRTIVRELLRAGIRDAVICPGSRSAAMVAALRACGQIRLYVQTDERSAAFFALGVARARRRPAAICVTSGSAVANVLPALCEAFALGAPLVLLSCDRPSGLRDAGLPQTTAQHLFCRPVVAAALDLADPSNDGVAAAAMAAQVAALARHLRPGSDCGPVQINIPLAGHFSSVDGLHGWSDDLDEPMDLAMPFVAGGATAVPDAMAALPDVIEELDLRPDMQGLIIAGPDDAVLPIDSLWLLAERTGFPVLADAPGGVRRSGIPGVIAESEFLVGRAEFIREHPDLIIRLGSAPVSSYVQHYLANMRGPVLRIDRRPIGRDFLARHFAQLVDPAPAVVAELAAVLAPGDRAWAELWAESAATARARIEMALDGLAWGEISAVAEALKADGTGLIHVANSLSLRLVNLLLPAADDGLAVYVNRGVSGIDGTIGSFLGELAGHGCHGLLIIGDLAAIHDIPALEAGTHGDLRGTILILNNGGAGLFDLLPVRSLPDYQRLVRNNVTVDFAGIAQAFGLAYHRCTDQAALRHELQAASKHAGLSIVEAVLPIAGTAPMLRHFLARVNGRDS